MADILEAIYSNNRRSILWQSSDASGQAIQTAGATNVLTPQVVLEEQAMDEMRITEHPVEVGASITDHAYKMPATVRIRAGWSPAGNNVIAQTPPADRAYLKSIYDLLRGLQTNRVLVWLVTGKRVYANMLLQQLGLTNDRDTENVLVVVATFQELIFASTQVVTVPPASSQQTPSVTQPPQEQGTVAALPGSAANTNALNGTLGTDSVFNNSGIQ
jgi:hypothetical protein